MSAWVLGSDVHTGPAAWIVLPYLNKQQQDSTCTYHYRLHFVLVRHESLQFILMNLENFL